MAKALPCPNCGTAKIRETSRLVPYVLGKAPSSFSGQASHPFTYKCACQSKLSKALSLTFAQWRALPDVVEETAAPAAFVMPEGHRPGGFQKRKKRTPKQ